MKSRLRWTRRRSTRGWRPIGTGLSAAKQTSLAFPNLRVGSTIVSTLRERFAAVPHATQFHYVMEQAPRPVRQDRFHAEFRADRPMTWRAQAMEDFQVQASLTASISSST